MIPDALSEIVGSWGYPALLALLVLTGFGSPIPEDVVLLTAGDLVAAGVFEWPLVLVVSGSGVVVNDLMLYSVGRCIAWRGRHLPPGHVLSPMRLQRGTHWFARFGQALVLAARLVPGTRAIVFVTAGIHSIPLSSFLRYDILGAALWVPAMLAAGWTAGNRARDPGSAENWVAQTGPLLLLAVAVLLLTWLWRWRAVGRAQADATMTSV